MKAEDSIWSLHQMASIFTGSIVAFQACYDKCFFLMWVLRWAVVYAQYSLQNIMLGVCAIS